MPQLFGLYEYLSVMENMRLYARLRGMNAESHGELFAELLEFTRLAPFTARLAGKLSGGMKQKLGLACALMARPRSEEHTSELQSLMRISYGVFCLQKRTTANKKPQQTLNC